ncbi:MAG: 50S ribosomal protein L9 [Parcubacteria bacterium OLB19]|nr:MAG: 50S ribosomal protein L9 [Parcubacteria bacterium OLB19]
MKVILLRDVAKIGKRFEIVNVPDGFAINKLIPMRDAEPATPANVKRVTQNKERLLANKNELRQEIAMIVEKITSEPITLNVEANDQGHLFQAIHAKDITKSAKDRNLNLSEEYIVIDQPIKSVGEHQINIKLGDFNKGIIIKVVAK